MNYRSDFTIVITLLDSTGAPLPFPDYDFTIRLYTVPTDNGYTVGRIGGVLNGCSEDNGRVRIPVDAHCLQPGELRAEFTADLPDEDYADGRRRIDVPASLGIKLVPGVSDGPDTIMAQIMMPYIKGDPFRYEDFTPEQLDELKRPAEEAANRLQDVYGKLTDSEFTRAESERARVAAELARKDAEASRAEEEARRAGAEKARQTAEEQRIAGETARAEVETTRRQTELTRMASEETRELAEELRKQAEQSRADEETKRQAAEAQRAGAETVRVENEQSRTDRELLRVNAEKQRVSAEEKRAEMELERETAETSRQTAEAQRVKKFDSIVGELSEGKIALFTDKWNLFCGERGKYDPLDAPDSEHPFLYNRFWLTYDEAVAVVDGGGFALMRDISVEALRRMVAYSTDGHSTVIDVHKDVYEKLSGMVALETSVQDEWKNVLVEARNKKICFATTLI